MLEPMTPSTWRQGIDLPSRLFGDGSLGADDYELYEEDGEFVLSVEMPGFEREEISVAWDDGLLNVGAEHVEDGRNRKRTYHRRFRFPKEIDTDAITAEYTNGVLEVRLPIAEDIELRGKEIPIEG